MRVFVRRLLATAWLTFVVASPANAGDGAKLYNEFLDTQALYADEDWQGYVDRIGKRLLRYANTGKEKFYFFVLDSPQINAFATADAYIFVNRGLLLFLNSEDQLAAVIGHEIGHVIASHHGQRRSTSILGRGVGITAWLLTGRPEMMQVSDAATRALIAGYGREMELEADHIGAELIARAGYNPMAVIEALHVLKDQALFSKTVKGQPQNYHGLFTSHPRNDKRLHDVVSYAQAMMPENLAAPVEDFWTMVDGLRFGTDLQLGTLDQRVFFDKSLRLIIEFPATYSVTFNNTQVVGIHRRGRETGWIRVTRHTPERMIDAKTFVEDTLKREDIKEESEVSVNGRDTYLAELEIEGTKKQLSLLGVVIHGTDIFSVRGEAGARGDEKTFRDEFVTMMGGIRDMRPTDIQQDTSTRIKVVVAKPGDTYESLAQHSPIGDHGVAKLRLLNGDYPTGEPRAGDYIKVVSATR